MTLIRVHHELRAILVDGEAEVVGDGLVHVEARRPAQSGGEIDPFLPMIRARPFRFCNRE